MVKIVRQQSNPYKWDIGLQPLQDIANVEHFMPRDWISEDGFLPNEKFIEYARPLIEGEVRPPTEGGLPRFVTLERSPVEKNLCCTCNKRLLSSPVQQSLFSKRYTRPQHSQDNIFLLAPVPKHGK
jgi:hypothetical protein